MISQGLCSLVYSAGEDNGSYFVGMLGITQGKYAAQPLAHSRAGICHARSSQTKWKNESQ